VIALRSRPVSHAPSQVASFAVLANTTDAQTLSSSLPHPIMVRLIPSRIECRLTRITLGTLTRYHLHPAAWLHKLPDNITFEEGALLEPTAVALAGIERSGLRLGDATFIAGAGPIVRLALFQIQVVY
jgi:hypothetical protein